MRLDTTVANIAYRFGSVKEVLGKANELKSGDVLAGVAARDARERVAAKRVLAGLTVKDITENPAVPYETDEVTRICADGLDKAEYESIKGLYMGELRERLLSGSLSQNAGRGMTPEVAAGLAKLMGNMDLIYAASRLRVTAKCVTQIGGEGVLAFRLQPNHPKDDPVGIAASVLEGLAYGAGDAVIGVNPVNDATGSVSAVLGKLSGLVDELEIPTQTCVLAHITTQMDAVRRGAPSDLMFQSIAGSQKSNESFGISAALIDEARALMLEKRRGTGENVLYFETGQGSELSAQAHFGADQVTMEARCYGFARQFSQFLVNTVVGFIGPEYLYDSQQVIRAGLEDHFMGKLLGVPMGCDCCYTNHMKADQNDIEDLSVLLSMAGCNYFMALPQGDDVMLGYQSTSYHDAAALRELCSKRPIREFEAWLESYGLYADGRPTDRLGDASVFLGRLK